MTLIGYQGYRIKFGEDASRVRLDDAPENLAVIRHIALNLLNRHDDPFLL